jgi:predicted PurR-regulated permease PerM
MQIDRRFYRSAVAALATVVLFAWVLNNLGSVAGALHWIYRILYPFLLGGAIAFILNVPMKKLESLLFGRRKKHGRAERPIAITLTVLGVMILVALAALVIIPGITDTVNSFVRLIPNLVIRLRELINSLPFRVPALDRYIGQTEISWTELAPQLSELVQAEWSSLASSGAGAIGGIVNGVTSFFIGVMFALYLLSRKEKLLLQIRKTFYALLPENAADKTLTILSLSRVTFSEFLEGQFLGAAIMSAAFFIFMSIFRIPFPVVISVLVFITAFIPIIGAYIAGVAGALLILLDSPEKVILFLALFLVLQQIMASLVYPRIVGKAIGLPSIWVLSAVILGGELMGILGALLFIPLCSVMYTLFRKFVKERLENRRIDVEKIN